jgi:hypothetical protein
MAKQIARLLKTDVMADIDIPAIAQFLQSQGRRGDTILAHINAKEAEMLRKMGGAEERNPVTGLPEYFTIDQDYAAGADPYKNTPNVRNTNYDLGQYDLPALDTGYSGDYSPGQMFVGGEVPYNVEIDSVGRNLPISIESDPTGYAGKFQMNRPYRGSGYGDELLDRFNVSGLRSDIPDMRGVRNVGGGTLVPDITIPNRPSAATLGPAALDARMRADRELSRETTAPGIMDRASAATGLSKEALARLGLAGLGTIQGVMASREASEQGRQARRETEALARPYQQRGEALIQQAQSGELTAAGQQQLQAVRARLAQGAEARGGVGAAQAAAQVEAFRQNLLQNQYDYGQKISNIGDQLMLGAIRTGLEADRYAAGLSNTYFTNMASIAVGLPPSMPTQARGEQ